MNYRHGFSVISVLVIFALLVAGGITYYVSVRNSRIPVTQNFVPNETVSQNATTSLPQGSDNVSSVEYRNDKYGFIFTLPPDWAGYSVIESHWDGESLGNN